MRLVPTSSYLNLPVRSEGEARAAIAAQRAGAKRDPLAFVAAQRAECADIARGKLRMARADHRKYNPASERVVDLLEDWSGSFADQ